MEFMDRVEINKSEAFHIVEDYQGFAVRKMEIANSIKVFVLKHKLVWFSFYFLNFHISS